MIGFLSQDSYTNRFSRVLHGDIMLLSSRYPLVVECRQCLAFETSDFQQLPGELPAGNFSSSSISPNLAFYSIRTVAKY